MNLKNTRFKVLGIEKKDYYNHFFELHGLPNSDYCFSVIQTWLVVSKPVMYVELNENLLLLKYNDVLDDDRPANNFTLIGASNSINKNIVNEMCTLTEDETNKIIVTESHVDTFNKLLREPFALRAEPGLNDYLYSTKGYSQLSSSVYRRIRREVNVFTRDHPTSRLELKEYNANSIKHQNMLIDIHHTWDNTFQYGNDPERTEGLVMARAIQCAEKLGLKFLLLNVDNKTEGFFIFTEVNMNDVKYADVHHARFSYNYRYINDYAFHLLGKFLDELGYDYINFERDADVEGLRKHKLLLKPVKMISGYSLIKH